MGSATYFQHQTSTPSWLGVQYWVEGSKESLMAKVLAVGTCHSFGEPEKIEILVMSETGMCHPISKHMRNAHDATMFKIVHASGLKENAR